MSNQDYDRQFQEDLAKATALSLEQQALDDYRRHKKYGTNSYQGGSADYYAQQQQQHQHHQQQRSYNVTQRRHSEVHQVPSSLGNVERSRTPPAQARNGNGNGDSDLICFASPTSKQPTTQEGGSTFERLIEDLQRMQTNNPTSALVPVGPVAAATPVPVQYPVAVSTPAYGSVPGGAGMQLVPFQPGAQPQQRPLNQEELQRLYSMPNQLALQPVAPVQPAGFMYYAPTFSAPVVPGSAAYMPPQYPSHGYGYGFAGYAPNNAGSTHVDFSRPHSTPVVGTASGLSTPAAAVSNRSSPLSHQIPHSSATTPAPSVVGFNVPRRATPPVGSVPSVGPAQQPQPPARTGNDLIDLNQDDYSRVSVLEAFDPLNENSVSQK